MSPGTVATPNVSSGVVARVDGPYIWVDIGDGGGCGSCKSKDGCGSGLLGLRAPSRQHRLLNTVGARAGDEVTVSMPEGGVLKAAMLAYLLPLLLGIAGAAAGMWLGGSDGTALSGLVGGLFGGWLMLRRIGRRREPWPQVSLKSASLQSRAVSFQPRFREES